MLEIDEKELEEIFKNLCETLNKIIEPILTKMKEVYEQIKKSFLELLNENGNNKIKKYITIYKRTKSCRIKNKQIKLIIRGMQVYFI